MMHRPRFDRASGRGDALNVIILSDHGWINGGQAKIAIESALDLRRRGVEVCFVAGSGPIDERLPAAGIECRQVGEHDILADPNRLRAAASGIWNGAAARVVAECIGARDPRSTIVHIHGWAKALSPSVGRVVTGADAAHVYTFHEYFLACPNGGFFDYSSGRICRRRPLGVDCLTTRCDSRSSAFKAWRVARQAVLHTAGGMPSGLREIIYLAPEQREIMGPYIPDEARWHLLPNPVGPRPKARVASEGNEPVLFIGRLSPEKGAEVAAEAAKIAGRKIVFCGDGECAESIRRINPDAVMAGWLSQDELAGWMERARCLLFPSLWYEGYPLVVADALRAGLPILVSDSTVARSSVRHGIDGLHVAAGDVEAWASAIRQLDCDTVARDFSTAAFAAGGALLERDAYVDRLIAIYEEAIARKCRLSSQQPERVP